MANSTFDLTGKSILVTGGKGGIGLAMAQELAKSGADICIWGQNEDKNKAAAEKFEKNVIPRIPQRRWGVPADFGPIAVYFASDASAYHSGDAVVIDGGYSCF
jgi:NAD(P)-dependent dehydrogenase (short-subunit alcohol dehydrogenase family)